MSKALRITVVLLLCAAASVVAALAAVLQSQPSVAPQAAPDHVDVERAMALVRSHDPRRAEPGVLRAIQIGERDLDVLFNHAGHRWVDASTRVSLERGAAVVRSSLQLPRNPFGRWLNVQARLAQTGALPVIESIQVGRLPLPVWLGERAGIELVQRAGLLQELELAADVVQRVYFAPQQMRVLYTWHRDSTERAMSALLNPAEQQRLRVYTEKLAALTANTPGWTMSLAPLLGPMFALAQQRSGGGDAQAENRAALAVLTLYANGRNAEKLVAPARDWPRPRPLRLTLAGREDTPLHFLVSAALAVEGTGPLSKAIGVYKEVADSRGGTGFSFNDLAADRAGTRFGERVSAQPREMQALLARGVQEADIMPPASDLPESIPEADFKRRYGGVGEPRYEALMAEIERRVDLLRVMR